jgi:hypothetical protein
MRVYPDQISNYYYEKLGRLKTEIDLNKVTPWEAAFLDDRWLAMEEFGEFMRLTPKQQDCLKDICQKMGL